LKPALALALHCAASPDCQSNVEKYKAAYRKSGAPCALISAAVDDAAPLAETLDLRQSDSWLDIAPCRLAVRIVPLIFQLYFSRPIDMFDSRRVNATRF